MFFSFADLGAALHLHNFGTLGGADPEFTPLLMPTTLFSNIVRITPRVRPASVVIQSNNYFTIFVPGTSRNETTLFGLFIPNCRLRLADMLRASFNPKVFKFSKFIFIGPSCQIISPSLIACKTDAIVVALGHCNKCSIFTFNLLGYRL